MMREIKFRAFDDKAGKMIFQGDYGYYVGTDSKGNIAIYFESDEDDERSRTVYKLENIMQYTGFKDETGREIYEGDVIEASGNAEFRVMPPSGMYDVEFGEGCFWANPRPRSFARLLLRDVAEYATIRGNIYEERDKP